MPKLDYKRCQRLQHPACPNNHRILPKVADQSITNNSAIQSGSTNQLKAPHGTPRLVILYGFIIIKLLLKVKASPSRANKASVIPSQTKPWSSGAKQSLASRSNKASSSREKQSLASRAKQSLDHPEPSKASLAKQTKPRSSRAKQSLAS